MPNNKTSPTFKVTSLGCPKNLVDSEIMIGLMGQSGFRVVPTDQPAQVHIINTCSFVGDAKSESIDHILSASQTKKEGGISLLVVTGCLPQRYQKKISRLLPEVDLFVGTGDYERLPTLIAQKLIGTKKRNFIHQQQFLPTHLTPRVQSTAFYTKYVKISEGCSHQCSFCIIPTIRGKLLSRQPEDIVQEIKTGVASGIREFNLVAQDLNEYGRDLTPKSSLNQLLKLTSDIKGDYWIRLLYMYPLQFPDRLIDTIADHPHVARYVDIPLQHISDHLLKKMRRGSSRRYIMRLIDQLKNKIPDITLRTTFIVGHPGETKKDFEELKKFVADVRFDHLGVFAYSDEDDTPAHTMPGHLSEELMTERKTELMELQRGISLKKNKALVGKKIKVLFEGTSSESELLYQGRHAGQTPEIDGVVLINSGTAKVGTFCTVKVTEAHEYDLVGKVV